MKTTAIISLVLIPTCLCCMALGGICLLAVVIWGVNKRRRIRHHILLETGQDEGFFPTARVHYVQPYYEDIPLQEVVLSSNGEKSNKSEAPVVPLEVYEEKVLSSNQFVSEDTNPMKSALSYLLPRQKRKTEISGNEDLKQSLLENAAVVDEKLEHVHDVKSECNTGPKSVLVIPNRRRLSSKMSALTSNFDEISSPDQITTRRQTLIIPSKSSRGSIRPRSTSERRAITEVPYSPTDPPAVSSATPDTPSSPSVVLSPITLSQLPSNERSPRSSSPISSLRSSRRLLVNTGDSRTAARRSLQFSEEEYAHAEGNLQQWMQQTVPDIIFNPDQSFYKNLASGTILCRVMFEIWPQYLDMKKVKQEIKSPFHASANLQLFLNACEKLGIKKESHFSCQDLMQEKNKMIVLGCLGQMFDRAGTM